MLEYTILCIVASIIVWPMLISGTHFHLTAFLFALYPISWGFVMLGISRVKRERIIAWVAFLFSVLAIWAEIEGNTRWLIATGTWYW